MKPERRKLIALLGLVLALMLGPGAPPAAAPKAELWERWTAHDPASDATIDHVWWTGFLDTYLEPGDDGINRFDYGRVNRAGKAALKQYVADLAGLPISSYNRDEQFAYWVNLYNALTTDVLLDHYPVASIIKIAISPGWFSIGPWGKTPVTIEGEDISLDDIEHRILRPIWRDPRIHYAVNCTALSCPNLMPEAFTGANANSLLDQAAWEYINRPGIIEVRGRGLVVSSLYEWYTDDFGGDDDGVIAHLLTYADGDLAAALESATRIVDDRYDWALNDAGAKVQAARSSRGSGSNN